MPYRKAIADMTPEADFQPPWACRPIGQCRRIHAAGPRIHRDIITDHPGTLGMVARHVSVLAAQLARVDADCPDLADGSLNLAGKATDSHFGTW